MKKVIISLLIIVALGGLAMYFLAASEPDEAREIEGEVARKAAKVELERAQSRVKRAAELKMEQVDKRDKWDDRQLFLESLEKGYIPTQETGELGSSHGALTPDSGMVYAESKYERLADSPLLRFTDEMIWRDGDEFVVKRDAMHDQALHIQEASIALSVSARIEWGQLKGYRLVEVPEGTLFSKLGIVSGDVVLSINGGKPDMEVMALKFVDMVARRGASTVEIEHLGEVREIRIRAE
ncbi:MAG: hypothetical protein WC966_02365 [Bradymonadales bacterium]